MIELTLLELIWTITPALVLIAIAFPSFKLLYTLDEVIDPSLTIKVTGYQEDYIDSLLNEINLFYIYSIASIKSNIENISM
jgi:heme/copper-type cytochrome/quinol oxidase subunit 2